jgi:hypothetical protein
MARKLARENKKTLKNDLTRKTQNSKIKQRKRYQRKFGDC